MKLRIFRQPTKDVQPNGEFHIDTLQYETIEKDGSYTWIDVPVVEAESYEG